MQHHKKIMFAASIFGCMGVLAGCNQHYRVDPVMSTSETTGLPWKERSESGFLTEVEKLNPYTYSGSVSTENGQPTVDSLYQLATGTEGETRRKEARNQLQAAIMRISDETTAVHLAAVKATENNTNLFLGIPALGLSAAAAISPSGAAQSLSTASTALQGSRSFINEQVFRNTLFESIILLIEGDRSAKKAAIRAKWNDSIVEYNVEAALQDAAEYHQAGSFYHGLSLLADAANDRANQLRGSRGTLESPGVLSTFLAKTDIARAESEAEVASESLKRLNAMKVSAEAALAEIKGKIEAESTPAEEKEKLKKIAEQMEGDLEKLTNEIEKAKARLKEATDKITKLVEAYTKSLSPAK